MEKDEQILVEFQYPYRMFGLEKLEEKYKGNKI